MENSGLAKRFAPLSKYREFAKTGYTYLPFRFDRLSDGRVVITNEACEHLVLSSAAFQSFVDKVLAPDSALYQDLKSKHFLLDSDSTVALDLLALKVRTKYRTLRNFTSLHLFVVTLRCDYSCPYCQVSRQKQDKLRFDMPEEVAVAGVDFVFQSPSRCLKIEFQGGEPLLNFPLIKFIVELAESRNADAKRTLEFVIATNLSHIDDAILEYCEQHRILISTSLDGPRDLHDSNRPRPGRNGHELTVEAIQKVRRRLGRDSIAALMTTTEDSLDKEREIIDEYVRQGFDSIFLRSLSPYGFAVKTRELNRYSLERWISFYRRGLEYIISLNKNGIPFREEYASIVLTSLLTPYGHGFVDLQSPAGIGISAIVFNYDGDVYASDESRMLAEMGDKKFRLGSLKTDSYDDIIGNETLLDCLQESITESVPMCRDCAYKTCCGSDPVYHYATQGDWVGHKAKSGFCTKNTEIFRYIITLLEDGDDETKAILRSWARR
jgi:uncharacterized protein